MSSVAPNQKPPSPDLGGEHAYRRSLPEGGRVHVDRPLPFLLLARHTDASFSLARRIAAISAASVIWPESEGDDADVEAVAEVAALLDTLHDDYPRFLVVTLHDEPRDASLDPESPRLEPYEFAIGASDDAAARTAADTLRQALAGFRIELRRAHFRPDAPRAASARIEALLAARPGISHLSLGIPQIHRIPGKRERVYPQIYHQLELAVSDALLQAIAHFIEVTTPDGDGDGAPGGRPHHRSLGRSRFIKAAARADTALSKVSSAFDFLLCVSPINTVAAYERFEADGRRTPPEFRYRPLPVDPDTTKRKLYAIDLRAVEDPVLEQLFSEKRHELDQQLMMLQRRNTPAFRQVSQLQYGGVEAPLLEHANAVLANFPSACSSGGGRVGATELHAAAERMLQTYAQRNPAFAVAKVCVRDDTGPGLMVSGRQLLISSASSVPTARVDPLLQHEIGVHVLTHINGSQQGLGIFGAGLAGYEGVQEGLGVFAEFLVGGLTVSRLRLLAARVLVVHAMLEGEDFIGCHHLLHDTHGFSSQGAFNIVARIFRSGGLTKDAIYLRGLHQVVAWVAAGHALDPFWYGKIAEHHVPVVQELQDRGMLQTPAVLPEFLQRPIAQTLLARLRAGDPFLDLLKDTPP